MAASGKKIELKQIEDLIFDSNNPRLPSTIDKTNEKEVTEWMLKDATLLS